MDKTTNWEEISFGIITYSGVAKSNAIIAMRKAKNKEFEESKRLLEEAEQNIVEAEKLHMDIIAAEADGKQIEFKVIFMHAEDQMLTAQMMIETAKEIVDIWKEIKK